MNNFSLEIAQKKDAGDYDSSALSTLEILKKRSEQKGHLFEEQENKKFEIWKERFPDEYEILQNNEAFYDLPPEEQRQIVFEKINGHRFDPLTAKFIFMED